MRRHIFSSVAALAVGVTSVFALHQAAPVQTRTLQEQLQAKFVELHRAASFPGGTAGFVLEDGTSFGIAVGVSDRAAGTPMKATDRLLTGSVGKTYASAVALQMMHEQKFGLGDTLDEFFGAEPWFPRIANASKITGLGVIIRPSPVGITYGHSGFMPGYQTELVYFPELKASVAVQVNSSAPRSTGKSLRAFAMDFAAIIAGK